MEWKSTEEYTQELYAAVRRQNAADRGRVATEWCSCGASHEAMEAMSEEEVGALIDRVETELAAQLNPEMLWTDAMAEDLRALARLAALAPITQVDDEMLPLFGTARPTEPGQPAMAPWSGLALLTTLGAMLGGFFRTWPGNAPLIS